MIQEKQVSCEKKWTGIFTTFITEKKKKMEKLKEKAFGYFCIICIIFRIHYSHTSLPFIYITPYLLQCLKHYLSYLFVIHIAWIELILVNWSRQESWGMHIGFCIDLWDGFKTRIVPLIRNQKIYKIVYRKFIMRFWLSFVPWNWCPMEYMSVNWSYLLFRGNLVGHKRTATEALAFLYPKLNVLITQIHVEKYNLV